MQNRDWLFVGCEAGHDWKWTGNRNAGCSVSCDCSVPVHECTRCGDCDYGHNDEAVQVKADCAESWCICGRPGTSREDPCCDNSGRCEASPDARDITNCIHCGKELHERDGQWWTYDADQHENPQPQMGSIYS